MILTSFFLLFFLQKKAVDKCHLFFILHRVYEALKTDSLPLLFFLFLLYRFHHHQNLKRDRVREGQSVRSTRKEIRKYAKMI